MERDPQTHVPSVVKTRVWTRVIPEKSDLNLTEDHEAEGAGISVITCSIQ